MKKKFLTLLGGLIVLINLSGVCQQEPIYSLYMFNGAIINPAYPSVEEVPNLTFIGRNQWVGIEGAPKTLNGMFNYPFKTGTSLGVMLYTDRIGHITNNYSGFHISQRVTIGEESYLALGIRLGYGYYAERNEQLRTNDPVFQQNVNYKILDVGFGGVYFNKNYYLGISSPNFSRLPVLKNDTRFEVKKNPLFFLQGGCILEVNNDLLIKPNLLFKFIDKVTPQIDVNLNAFIANTVWAGISWRSMKTISAVTEIEFSDSFSIGYAYDLGLGSYLQGSPATSHELMINFRFNREEVVRGMGCYW